MDPVFCALILIGCGLGVILLEMFVPSAGILGILAALLIISGVVFGFSHSLRFGIITLVIVSVAVPITLALMVKVWPHTPLGKRILLNDIKAEDVLPNSSHYQKRNASLVGRLGVAKTTMLPSGIVIIDGEKFDAVSEGFAVDAGDAIKVIDVRENRLYVHPYDSEDEDVADLPVRDRDILSQPIDELGIDSLDDPLG